MTEVTIVDYGLGNVFSAQKSLEACGAVVNVSADPDVIITSPKLILPGVGAFKQGMDALSTRGLVEPIRERARLGRPMLGICLGMQLLFEVGREFGESEGLAILPGAVELIRREDKTAPPLRIPHVGWNDLRPAVSELNGTSVSWNQTLLHEIEPSSAFVYFVHSYVAVRVNPAHVLANFRYDEDLFVAAVQFKSTWGCQFHPERSGKLGLRMIKNFLQFSCSSIK